ncbi:MAG TPA: 2OG-Fe(II) oxygenase, partial [Acidimicrobiia bacterium]|nr:2OG-Fe(II) oxygenase [Acidimicrobiia bacterium]
GDADLALDSGGQVFRILDGSGTDVVAVAGRFHAGNERPVAVIDPAPGEPPGGLAALRAALEDPGSRDLAALLRYDGAADGAADGKATEVAPDILVMPFWTPEFCATLVRAAEAAGIWTSDPDDPVPGAELSLFSLSPRLAGLLEEDLIARVWPALNQHWPEAAVTGIHDAFVIRYEPGGATEGLPLHHDVAQVSATVRLNDGFAGGALAFPRQEWDTTGVPVGHVVAWPSLVTHPHRAEPVHHGVRYGLTVWFALPGT